MLFGNVILCASLTHRRAHRLRAAAVRVRRRTRLPGRPTFTNPRSR